MEGYRGNSRGCSHLWDNTGRSVTMALARLVDRRRAGVKSFLPVCHKAEWPSSSIRCDPLVFGLSSRLCFLVCLSFQCLKAIQKIEKGKRYDFLEWPRLSIDEVWKWLSSSARTYFDLKMEKFRAPSTFGQLGPCALRHRQLPTREPAPNGEERCRRSWIGLSLAVDRIACQGWRLYEPSDREGTSCAVRIAWEWEKRVWGCFLYYTVRTSSVSARTWTLPAFFLAFSFIVWVSQSMLFLHTLSRWRAKPSLSFFSFLVWSELLLVCEIEKLFWWVDIPATYRFSRAFTCIFAVSRALGWRDRGKSNSYTFRPHRRPACVQNTWLSAFEIPVERDRVTMATGACFRNGIAR